MSMVRAPMLRRLSPMMVLLVLTTCSDSASTGPNDFDADLILAGVSTKVILPTYIDLQVKAAALNAAVVTLNTSTTDDNLAAARNAWRAARRPWEQSESFLFGPVETKGIDPSIDSWPVNTADLDAVLGSSTTLTKEYIDGLEGTLKGFHTIEYLLFGPGSSKVAADLTAREREYLIAVTASLLGAVTQLRNEWDPAGNNFADVIVTSGQSGNAVYTSQSQALQEIINGMIAICDEVGNGKISNPFDQQDRSLEESQFSNNSNVDFADNIRSVQNIYLGDYQGSAGIGIRALILAKQASLDATIQAQIAAAITAIGQMVPTFGEAITTNQAAVEAARAAVGTLRQAFESQVLPLATQ